MYLLLPSLRHTLEQTTMISTASLRISKGTSSADYYFSKYKIIKVIILQTRILSSIAISLMEIEFRLIWYSLS